MLKQIDIFDKDNRPTGQVTDIDTAISQGLWHRGVAVVICTKTGYILVQKRSRQMVMHPGLLDFSAGGFVDSGEMPVHSAIREVNEELSLKLRSGDLHPAFIYRKNHILPKRKGFTRAFVYCYVVCLPDHHIDLSHVQRDELDWAAFLPKRKIKRLLRGHALRHVGRLEPTYAYYRKLLAATKPFV